MSVMALEHTPGISKSIFKNRSDRLESKALKNPSDSDLLINTSKNLTIYSFGFTMDEACLLYTSPNPRD